MTMMSKIADRHLSRQACIYIRQSTLAQVRSNQESTDRQYNLLNKAQSLGWKTEQIRVLDRDLGQSGAAATKRTDFKALVGDVAMGQIGAIFALEASRLARSNQDWHVPWHVFGRLVDARGADARVRRLATRDQFVALLYGQLAGAQSLREIESGLASHAHRFYHLGTRSVSRSTLADANATRPSEVFGALFAHLVAQAGRGLRRKIGEAVHLIDSTGLRLAAVMSLSRAGVMAAS